MQFAMVCTPKFLRFLKFLVKFQSILEPTAEQIRVLISLLLANDKFVFLFKLLTVRFRNHLG